MRKASTETLEKYKEETRDICVLEAAEGVDTIRETTGLNRKVICFSDGEFRYSTSAPVQRRIFRRGLIGETEINRTAASRSSFNHSPCSCCSSHGSTHIDKEASKFSDLEEEQIEIIGDASTSPYGLNSCRERREREETMPLPMSDVIAESFKVTGELPLNTEEIEQLFSVAADVNPSRRSKRAKMPSNAELDEFFSVTENQLMQQFSHKYNFDFIKEEPLEGMYEWVRLKGNSETQSPRCITSSVRYLTPKQEDNNVSDISYTSSHCTTIV